MAANNSLTLGDLGSRLTNNALAPIIELLTQKNRVLEDVRFIPSTNKLTDEFTVRNKLPRGTWVSIGQGVGQGKSGTGKVVEAMGKLSVFSTPRADIVRLSGNPQQFRSQEDMAFIDGMSQQCVGTLIYGSQAAEPSQFDGLASRLNTTSSFNVFSGGGSGSDLTSIWLANWDPMSGVYAFYPPEVSDAGISMDDLGEDVIEDPANVGTEYRVFRTHFEVWWGMGIKDHRMVMRYANIETDGTSNIFDPDTMIRMLNQMWTTANSVFYCNRTMMAQIDIAAADKANVNYYSENVFGVPTMHFQGVPLKLVEQILNTESVVA